MPWLVFSIIANHAVDAILDFCRDTEYCVKKSLLQKE